MLEIKNVSKEYYGHKGIFNINLNIENGSIVGILGRNGCGKTTLLKSILGLQDIDHGEVLFDGKSVDKQYERVAYICESGSFIAYMSAKQYGDFLASYYQSFDMDKYNRILKDFEVDVVPSLKSLSRGQQLKVEIAAGLSINADLLILDEPFTTLDVYAKEDTVKLIIEQFKENSIILISTHNIEEIEHVIDRCIVLDGGNIVDDVKMEEVNEKQGDLRSLLDKYRPIKKD